MLSKHLLRLINVPVLAEDHQGEWCAIHMVVIPDLATDGSQSYLITLVSGWRLYHPQLRHYTPTSVFVNILLYLSPGISFCKRACDFTEIKGNTTSNSQRK